MGGVRKKPSKEGTPQKYYTRSQALRKLQLKLSDFRKLCVLKGIHPREPKRKFKGQNQTYYHAKDIAFLLHEPLLERFRQMRAFDRKIKRFRSKGDHATADRLAQRRPSYTLDHLVKERYPAFVDALRDLDDPLTMLHLFATLPADKTHGIPADRCQRARRLALEFQSYVSMTHSLRKVFISVKGFYFQVEMHGQTITWLMPHSLSQVLPPEVDYRIMLTFLEFYETLTGFVNFKLFHELGVEYPPPLDPVKEAASSGVYELLDGIANRAMSSQQNAERSSKKQREKQRIDDVKEKLGDIERQDPGEDAEQEKPSAPGISKSADEENADEDKVLQHAIGYAAEQSVGQNAAQELAKDRELCATLFKGLRIFLGREVPKEPFAFAIRSFGGEVGWEDEGSPFGSDDTGITHQVMDRPQMPTNRVLNRDYVQPQWVFDSINFRVLAPVHLYEPGTKLPPHVSPFVDHNAEQYKPDFVDTMERLAAGEDALAQKSTTAADERDNEAQEDGNVATEAQEEEASDDAVEPEDEEEAEQRELHRQFTEGLQAELAGKSAASDETQAQSIQADEKQKRSTTKRKRKQEREAAEAQEMAHLLLPRKKRELYEAMQKGISKKQQRANELKRRKRADPTAGA